MNPPPAASGPSWAKAAWLKFRPWIARHRRQAPVRALSWCCDKWLKAYENCNGDFATNGEAWLLQSFQGEEFRTVFDVGSHLGDWASLALECFPNATVHAFELSPPTYLKLAERARGQPRLVPHQFGLSDQPGDVDVLYYPDTPGETSALQIPGHGQAEKLRGRVETGAAFCASQGIEAIDVLKIDVEGMESFVLRGFSSLLARQAIRLIQFEYEKLNPTTKFLLKDFHEFFNARDYIVGKLYPNYVDFRTYSLDQELVWGSNYVAVPHQQRLWIQRLAANSIHESRL